MKKILFGIIIAFGLSGQASAVIIDTSIGKYDVMSLAGTFTSLSGDLTSQAWWGDSDLAHEFATLTSDSLGLFELNPFGSDADLGSALFVYNMDVTSFLSPIFGWVYWSKDSSINGFATDFREHVYAVARAVPEPTTLAIFGLGLAGLGFIRRRRRAA